MQFINQNSLVLGAVALLAAVAVVLLRDGPRPRDFLVLSLLIVVFVAGWLVLRPKGTPDVVAGQVRAQIGQGVPVLLEFQSPF